MIDETKYYLGSLCRNRHNYEGTGQSLRYRKTNDCQECRRQIKKRYNETKGWDRKAWREKKTLEEAENAKGHKYNPKIYYLGSLCYQSHDYQNLGKSLRWLNNGLCKECSRGMKKRFYQKLYILNPEKLREQVRKYQSANPEAVKETRKRSTIKHWQARSENSKSWEKRNPIAVSEHARRKRLKRRGLLSGYKISSEKIKSLHLICQNKCVYCESQEDLTIDHVIPLSKGGEHKIDNLLIACRKCNSSKWNKNILDWYKEQLFYTQERWTKITRILEQLKDLI